MDDVKLLATNEYLSLLRDVKDTLMDLRSIYVYWGIVTIVNITSNFTCIHKLGNFF